MVVPVLRAFRESYPGVRISVLTRRGFRPFFRGIADLDFIDFDPDGRHKGFRGLIRLVKDILGTGVESVADMHDVLRTKIVRAGLRLAGLKVSVIDKGRLDKMAMTRKFRKIREPLKSTVERYRTVMAHLGYVFMLPPEITRQRQPLPEAIVRTTGGKSGLWVGFAPFAKHKGKIYPIAQAAELIELLSESYEQVFIFGGGSHEHDFASCMQERYERVVSVIGKLSLEEEMDLISNIDCMVTMDSATMHIASLVGTPVVSVWGATHPYAGFLGFGQDPANAIGLDLDCRPCSVYGNKPCLYKDYRCLTGITPESIAERVGRVINKENQV